MQDNMAEAMDMDHTYLQDEQDDISEAVAIPSSPTLTPESTTKIRKKPGRKPNPASPALRKAQNRAAQRAFRERKERHLRELEAAVKRIQEQRDHLQDENSQLKADNDILRSENWYLKGIVLTLQLVCLRHQLVIPQHSPYMNEEALSVLAQSIPEPIAAYMSVNANNRLPVPSQLYSTGNKNSKSLRDRYFSSGSLFVTKDGVHSVNEPVCPEPTPSKPAAIMLTRPDTNPVSSTASRTLGCVTTMHTTNDPCEVDDIMDLPKLTSSNAQKTDAHEATCAKTPTQAHIPLGSPSNHIEQHSVTNLAAIQTLRLRLRLQSVCAQTDNSMFTIQPTVLQLTIPHDPRIDLIPTPHMRDRMILFRDLFDLDDCFQCLIGNSIFHGGDPAVASNWELPAEFFDKYWFLTIDYQLKRITNKWRKLQGLEGLIEKEDEVKKEECTSEMATANMEPFLDMPTLTSSPVQHQQTTAFDDIVTLLPPDLLTQHNSYPECDPCPFSSVDSAQSTIYNSSVTSPETLFLGPIHLTANHASLPTGNTEMITDTCHPWDVLLNNMGKRRYEQTMDSL